MKKLFLLLVFAGLVTLAAYTCAFQVMQGETVIVAHFGDPSRTVDEPGLHFKWPPPIDTLVRIDGRIHVFDPGPGEYLTGEQKNVSVHCFLAWKVADPKRFHVAVGTRAGAEMRFTNILPSVVGDVISAYPFSALVSAEEQETTLTDVQEALTDAARAKMADTFGVEVVAARIKRINFPIQNKNAVFRRMEAEREAVAATFRSEGMEQYEKIKADTDRDEATMLAEADREAAGIRGEADAEAARIYAETIARDPELYEFLKSLEVLGEVLGDTSTLILNDDHPLFDVLRGPPRKDRKD